MTFYIILTFILMALMSVAFFIALKLQDDSFNRMSDMIDNKFNEILND